MNRLNRPFRKTFWLVLGYALAGTVALGLFTQDADAAPKPNPVPEFIADQPAQAPATGDSWQLRLVAVPDTVGVAGYLCGGCDHTISDSDRMAASHDPLEPLEVVVNQPGNRAAVYWHGFVQPTGGRDGDLQRTVTLSVPPPYEVRLLTTTTMSYKLCPNSRASTVVTQEDFDSGSGYRTWSGRRRMSNGGRTFQVGWYFWSCDIG